MVPLFIYFFSSFFVIGSSSFSPLYTPPSQLLKNHSNDQETFFGQETNTFIVKSMQFKFCCLGFMMNLSLYINMTPSFKHMHLLHVLACLLTLNKNGDHSK